MSQLATWQGKPRVGLDHAMAAAVWADQAHSPLARGYAADVAARAYAADNQPDKCRETLDQEYAALHAARAGEPRASWWYFYDESFYWSTEADCAVKLQRPEAAMAAVGKSLPLIDPVDLHNRTFTLLFRAEACIQQAEVAEASSIVADVAQLTAGHGSQRIAQRITDIRGLLTPWERTKSVRELDQQLAAYHPAVVSSTTKRTLLLLGSHFARRTPSRKLTTLHEAVRKWCARPWCTPRINDRETAVAQRLGHGRSPPGLLRESPLPGTIEQ